MAESEEYVSGRPEPDKVVEPSSVAPASPIAGRPEPPSTGAVDASASGWDTQDSGKPSIGTVRAAPITLRVLAFFIDGFIVFGVLLPLALQVGGALRTVIILLLIAYRPMTTAAMGGTVGKRLLGLRVVDAFSFEPLPAGRAIKRELEVYVSGIFAYVPCLTALGNAQRQAWYDRSVGSLVVRG